MDVERLISVAKGETPADLILTNARIVNTLNGETEEGNVAICGQLIAGVGDYERGQQAIDLKGKYLSPGLINGHIHPESSMLHISQYARAVVPRGTLAVATDFHEIANASGISGIEYMMNCARQLPLDVYLMVPSCVPATNLETSGLSNRSETKLILIRSNPSCLIGQETYSFLNSPSKQELR